MEYFPLMPVEEEGRLHDPMLRENFVERVFSLKRWRETFSKKFSMADLVEFHTLHKLLILSHSEKHYRTMGKLVAAGKEMPHKELYMQYGALLMEALRLKTTPKKNSNVLMHIMGYFKKQLAKDEKQELLEIIRQYHDGYIPLIVPITLISHYVHKYNQPYLSRQIYLHPHPLELQLRNHV